MEMWVQEEIEYILEREGGVSYTCAVAGDQYSVADIDLQLKGMQILIIQFVNCGKTQPVV